MDCKICTVTKTVCISGEKSSLTVCCPWENLVASFMSSKQQPHKLNDIFYGRVIHFGAAAHGVLLGGWFLGKIWWAPFKVQNVWMISMRNPCLGKTKVFSVLTRARISWTTIFFRNDHSVNCSSWKHNLIWLLLCPSRCSRASRNFSDVAASFSLLLNGALLVFESSTLFSSQNQPTSSPNLLSLLVPNHLPPLSFLFLTI